VFQGGLTTIAHLPEFRNPGAISSYCLHRTRSAKYHGIHVSQLRALTRMTE
jgi:predicted acetyltransferase